MDVFILTGYSVMAVSATDLSNFYNSAPSNSTLSSMQPYLASFDYSGVVADVLNVFSGTFSLDNTFSGLDKSKIFFSNYEKATRLCDSISQREIQTIASGLKANFKTEQTSLLRTLLKDGKVDEKPFRAVLEKIDQFKWEIGGQVRGACKLAGNIAAEAPYIAWVSSGNYAEKAKTIYQEFTTSPNSLPPEGETQIEAFVLKKGYKKAPEFQGRGTTPDSRIFKDYQSSDKKVLPPLLPSLTYDDSEYFKELGKSLEACKEGDLQKLYKERRDVVQEASMVFNQFSENFFDYDPDLSEEFSKEFSKELEPFFKKFSKLDLEDVQLKGRCKHYYKNVEHIVKERELIRDLFQVSKPIPKTVFAIKLKDATHILSDFSVEKEYSARENTVALWHSFTKKFQFLLEDLKYPLKATFEASLANNKKLYFNGQKELKKLLGDIDGDSLHETFKKRFIVCTPSGCTNAYNEEGYFYDIQHPYKSGFYKVVRKIFNPDKEQKKYEESSRDFKAQQQFKGCTTYTSKMLTDTDHVTRIAKIIGLSLSGSSLPKIDARNLDMNIKSGCVSDLSLAKDVLQISKDTLTKSEIKTSYNKVAKKVHPDHCIKDHVESVCDEVIRAVYEANGALKNRAIA